MMGAKAVAVVMVAFLPIVERRLPAKRLRKQRVDGEIAGHLLKTKLTIATAMTSTTAR